MKNFIEIRNELKSLIKNRLKSCSTEKEKNAAIEKARQEINLKYGKGWRELDNNSHSFPSVYDGHENGEYWMD